VHAGGMPVVEAVPAAFWVQQAARLPLQS